MNRILTTMALLVLTTITAWAEQKVKITVIPESGGTVTYEIVDGNSVKLTCKPENGYWLSKDHIKAVTSLDGGAVQSPLKRIPVDEGTELTITEDDGNTDVASESIYYFDLPDDQNLNVEVTAEFQSRTNIEGATVMVAYPEGGIIYNGEEQKPAIASVVLPSGTTLTSADYTVSGYSNNINVGEEAEVTVDGQGKYMGSATGTFTISAAVATVTKAPEALNPTYTGVAQNLVAAGETDNGTVVYSLTADGAFTETIPQQTEAGSYTVYYKATGDANHTESAVGNVTAPIAQADLSTVMVGAIDDQTFTGAEIKPAVTVTFNGKAVAADEYDVAYSDNINAGTATATLTSKDKNFSTAKTKTATFKIVAKALTEDMVAEIAAQSYTGEPLTPTVTVTDGDAILVKGEDYEVSYSDNVNVGENTATATITGKGNYTGSVVKTFSISAVAATVKKAPEALNPTYIGSAQNLVTAGETDNGTVVYSLTADGTFTETIPQQTEAGSYTVYYKATGDANHTESAVGNVTAPIAQADLSTVMVGAIDDQTFTGAEIKPAVTVTFNGKAVAADEYDVAYSDNINAGTATATLTSKDKNFSTANTKTVTFKIVAKTLTEDMVGDIATQAYTGEAIEPEVRVTDGDAILVKDTDYEVSYSDNINVGVNTATATITGKGNYSGSVVKTFSISSVAATVKKAPEALNPTYTGVAQDLVTAGKTDNGTVVYSLSADGEFIESIPQATEAGSYTVYYKATGDENHSESAVANVSAPIAKADLSVVTVGAIADQTFTGAEIKPAVTVTFNGNAVAEDEYDVAYSDNINAGTATVTLTSKDKNFSTAKTKTATFKIVAKTLTEDMVAEIAAQSYTGEPLTPTVTVTDGDAILVKGEDYEVSYSDNVNVGVNTATATITGKGNYTGSVVKTFSISAVAATVTKAPEALNSAYTGVAQNLVTAGETDNGTVVYSLSADGEFTESIPQATEAGSYTVYYKATGDENHTESAVGNVTAPIAKADLSTVTVGAIDDQTFTGAEIKPAVTVTFNGNAVAEDEYDVAYSDNTNAGTATVTLTSKDKNFSTAKTKTATFKIVAKALTEDMVGDIATQLYTGEPLTPAVTVTDGDAILVKGEDYEVSYSDNVNVGVNTAKATITGMGNYSGSVVKTFSISAVAATVTKAPEALNPTYIGSAQNLVTAGETDNGTVVYSLTADGAFTETIPQATDAGDYTVYYKATGDENHSESAVANVSATIAKADLSTVTIAAIDAQTYTGSQITPAVTVTFNGNAVSDDEYDVAYGENINAGAGAGTVTLTSKDKNFSTAKTKTATFTISPAKATLSYDKSELTAAVNETPEWPVLSNPQGAIIAYTSSKPEVATVDEETGSVEMKAIGTTTIKAAINDPNYQYADASYTLTVTSYAYKLKIDGMVVTEENRGELFEKSVMFDGKATLTLTDAHISGIESGLDTLEIYVIGDNIIESTTDYAIWDMTGGKQYLHIYTDMTSPGKLDLNSKTQVVSGFKEISIKEPMTIIDPDYVSYLNEEDVTYVLLGSPLDPIVDNGNKNNNVDYGSGGGVDDKTLTNTVVDNVLYTLNDTQEPNKNDDGFYNGMLIINSVMTDDKLEDALQMTPTTDEFAENFKGVTFMVPAGSGTVTITAYTKIGHALCISVGGNKPYLLKTLGATLTFDYNYTCTSATYVYIYHIQLSDVAGAPDMDNHRIGPKATVSTGIGGLSVSASSIDSPPGGKPNYLCMSKDDLMMPEGGVGHIIVANDEITDLSDDTFEDMAGNGGGGYASKRAASDYDISYIDLRGTSITGKDYSREEGPFKGIPVTTFIYLPAGNEVHSPNMVVGSVCDSLLLGDRVHMFEVAEGGFTAGRAIFERPFAADKKLPLYIPFGIPEPERYGTFFEFDKIEDDIVSMKKATTVEPNKPYYLQLKEDGEEIIDELGVRVEPLENMADSKFVGTYEFRSLFSDSYVYDNDVKMFRQATYDYAAPFEAYLTGINDQGKTLTTQWEGEPITSVKGVTAETAEEGQWYTLDGRQLQQQPNRKGIYLKGGKKRIVK